MDAKKYNVKWTREETILAYDLYCKTPFSRIYKTNENIRQLSDLLGRTANSVVLKMANLASCDPEVLSRNLKGMSNHSKLDEQIFNEFNADWEALSVEAQKIRAQYEGKTISELTPELEIDELPPGEYREQQTKVRVGHYFFHMAVLNAYGAKCCITGMSEQKLLRASHIKPWRVSDAKTERTNPKNGLLLNAFHDLAFDQGLITVDKNYTIISSKRLRDAEMDKETREWIDSYSGKTIMLPDKFKPAKEFLEYHNDVIFLG